MASPSPTRYTPEVAVLNTPASDERSKSRRGLQASYKELKIHDSHVDYTKACDVFKAGAESVMELPEMPGEEESTPEKNPDGRQGCQRLSRSQVKRCQ